MHKKSLFVVPVLCMLIVMASCRKSSVAPGTTGGTTGHEEGPLPVIEETNSPVLTKKPNRISVDIPGYYEALPEHYSATTNRYPVIFFFHGGGQYGNGNSDLDTLLTESIPKLIRDKTFPASFTVPAGKFSFIVIIPQLAKKVGTDQVDQLVEYAKANYRLDTSRIYFVGFSLGARQACDYAAFRPLQVAATVSMAGLPVVSTLDPKCASMVNANLPLWQVHNKDDSAWSYTESQTFINKLNALSPAIPPKFTLFDVGSERLHHDCWTKVSDPAYKEEGKNIYEWMLSFTR